MNNFKKTLIISSYAPPSISGSALMMYNLFCHFPQDSIIFLTSYLCNEASGINNKKLKAKYYYFDNSFLGHIARSKNSFFAKFLLINLFIKPLMFFYIPMSIILKGIKILKDDNIDLLLGYSDRGPALFSTYLLHKLTKKPFYVYFYDLYLGNKIPLSHKILAYFFEKRIFKSAKKIFVVNETTRDYYKEKYNRESVVIYNSVLNDGQKPELTTNKSNSYKIIFTGAIYFAQAQAIRNLIKAVKEINDLDINFLIYTTYGKNSLNNQGIFEDDKIFFRSASPQDIQDIQKKADILFVPLAFETGHDLLINTASPGKTYEYLLSGRPILVHAPKDSYISKYAKANDFAVVVDENSVEKLKFAIKSILNNNDLVKRLTDNAWNTFLLNHDARKSAVFFQKFFRNK